LAGGREATTRPPFFFTAAPESANSKSPPEGTGMDFGNAVFNIREVTRWNLLELALGGMQEHFRPVLWFNR
jgi:hypothetical protein